VVADHWARGGEGAVDLARAVVMLAESGKAKFKLLYPDEMPLWDKVRTIAQRLYGAQDVEADKFCRYALPRPNTASRRTRTPKAPRAAIC
jgi:formate--tetrahydrofolate ligase